MRAGHAHAVLSVLADRGFAGRIAKHANPAREVRSALQGAALGMTMVAILSVAWVGSQRLPRTSPPRPAVAGVVLAAGPRAPGAPRELARQAVGAAAALRCRSTAGSGFFVEPDLLITNDSVLRWGRCDRTKVESGIEVRLEVPRIVHEAVLPPE